MKYFLNALAILILVSATLINCKSTGSKNELPPDYFFNSETEIEWFKEAKFGMFIHWGPYSQLGGEWKGQKVEVGRNAEWIMKFLEIPVQNYQELAREMNPDKFNAREWVQLAKSTGMKYIVITAKHHDGFAMYKSDVSPYNIYDWTGFKRDPLRELAEACAAEGIVFGIYYSHREDWDHPGGYGNDWDFDNDWGQNHYHREKFEKYLEEKAKPQLRELLSNYGPLGLVWFDRGMFTREQGEEFVKIVRELQPSALINSRVGHYDHELLGDFQEMSDKDIPPGGLDEYFQTPQTLNETWGYSKFDTLWKDPATVIRQLVQVVSRGGNYLLNIGPKGDGEIPDTTIKIFNQVGDWMERNSEAIYGTNPNPFGELNWGYCTQKKNKLYLFVHDWPSDGIIKLSGMQNSINSAYLLVDESRRLSFNQTENEAHILVPPTAPDKPITVVVVEFEGPLKVEPPLVIQDESGSLTLNYLTAVTSGNAMTRFNRKGGFHISKWTRPEDSVEWKIRINKPGKFKVNITYSASKEWGGKLFDVLMNDNVVIEGRIVETNGLFDYYEFPVGYIEIPESGEFNLSVRPKSSGESYFMYLQSISVIPVPDIKVEGWGILN
jgi:alpha-L-fucosidase